LRDPTGTPPPMPTLSALSPPTAIPAPVATDSDAPGVPNLDFADIWADGKGMSFSDLLDIINPLQHIPIASTICRAITGDRIGVAIEPALMKYRHSSKLGAGRTTAAAPGR